MKVWPSTPHAVQWRLGFFVGFDKLPELVVVVAATLDTELAGEVLFARLRFLLPFFLFDFSFAFDSAGVEVLSSSPGVAS